MTGAGTTGAVVAGLLAAGADGAAVVLAPVPGVPPPEPQPALNTARPAATASAATEREIFMTASPETGRRIITEPQFSGSPGMTGRNRGHGPRQLR